MGAFKVGFTTTGQSLQVMMPDSLKLLPVMILGLLKSVTQTTRIGKK